MATESLSALVGRGDADALKRALDAKRGGNINSVDAKGYTPLYLASMKPETAAMVPLLLAAGAQVDQKGDDKETPLYIAVFNDNKAAVERLLKANANPNAANGIDDDAALHVAARLGFDDIVAMLMEAGATINVRNKKQETPLFVAAKGNRIEVVYRLLKANANRSLLNNESKDAMYIASERGHKGIVEMLKADADHLAHAVSLARYEEKNKPAPIKPLAEEVAKEAATKKKDEPAGEAGKPAAAATMAAMAPPRAASPPKASSTAAAKPQPVPPASAARKTSASPAKRVSEQIYAATSSPPGAPHAVPASPAAAPDVPKPSDSFVKLEDRTHDPLTGKKLHHPKCKTMYEAGLQEPAPIPAGVVKDLPELHANYGGTMMIVGTGTEERVVQRKMFEPSNGEVFLNHDLNRQPYLAH